ncbi:hypothetical protein HK096_008843, partial [Nowakowskiella sp. JEL0078]
MEAEKPYPNDTRIYRKHSLPQTKIHKLESQQLQYSSRRIPSQNFDAATVAAVAASAAFSANILSETFASLSKATTSSPHSQMVYGTAPRARKPWLRRGSGNQLEAIDSVYTNKPDLQPKLHQTFFQSVETQTSPISPPQSNISDLEAKLLNLLLLDENGSKSTDLKNIEKEVSPSQRVKFLSDEVKMLYEEMRNEASELEMSIDRATNVIQKLIDEAKAGISFDPETHAETTKKSNKPKSNATTGKAKNARTPKNVSKSPSIRNNPLTPVSSAIKLSATSPYLTNETRTKMHYQPSIDKPQLSIHKDRSQSKSKSHAISPKLPSSRNRSKQVRESTLITSQALARAFESIDTSAHVEEGLGLDFLTFESSDLVEDISTQITTSVGFSEGYKDLSKELLPELSLGDISLSTDLFNVIEKDSRSSSPL